MKERKVCQVVTEPFNVFLHYKDGVYNPLYEIQRDPIRNIVPGQIHIITESRKHYSTVLGWNASVVLSDRSLFSCYAFIDCYFHKGLLSPFSKDFVLKIWREECEKVQKPDCFIFLDVPPYMCKKRLSKDEKCTPLDKETWTEDFLSSLQTSHEKMFTLLDMPVKRVNVQEDRTPCDVALAVHRQIVGTEEEKFS